MSTSALLKLYDKPMAISSITSPTSSNGSLLSTPKDTDALTSSPVFSSKTNLCNTTLSPQSISSHLSCSVPNSPEILLGTFTAQHSHSSSAYPGSISNSTTKQQYQLDYPSTCVYSTNGHHRKLPLIRPDDPGLQHSNPSNTPLTLNERRQRNKAASAKYRAKKNQQHGEMRFMISSLTKENDLLQRQLDQAREENRRLKSSCDKLRGKMLAEKMLKKLLNGSTTHQMVMNDDDSDDEENFEPREEMLINNNFMIKDIKPTNQLNIFAT
jgi:hypothetical protein